MASEREMETATVPRSQLVSIVQLWLWQTDARVRNEEDALRLAREKVADMERSALQPTPEATHLREVNAALVEALKLFLVDWSGDQSPPRKVLIARAALAAAEPRGEGGRG